MPGVYIGTSPLKSAYVGTTPVKEIYVGTTKVRPSGWAYSYDFTTGSVADFSSQGWTVPSSCSITSSGLTANSSNWITVDAANFSGLNNALQTAKNISIEILWNKGSSGTYRRWGLYITGSGDGITFYGDGRNATNGIVIQIGSTVVLSAYDSLSSGEHLQKLDIDLQNKLASWNLGGSIIGSGTFTDADVTKIKTLTGFTIPVTSNSYIKSINVTIGTTKVRPSGWQPGANTVAYRPLNSTTTVNDQSGNNYNLTKTDGSFTTLGNVSCFYNGGSSIGYFTLNSAPKIPSGNADRTILLWARPSSYSPSYSRYFLDYGGGRAGTAVYLTINTDKKYYASVYSGGITGNTMPTSAWSLMTFVSSGNTFYLYANGELQGSNTATINTTAVSSSYPFRLMGQNTSTSSNYQVRGYLSEVIIEDKAWTAAEIANYFNDNKEKYGL